MNNYIIVLLTLLAFHTCSFAQQTIIYGYDDSGNRISKGIPNTSNKSAEETIAIQKKAVKDIIGNLEVTVYPNPTKGNLIVEFINYDNNFETTIGLYSIQGKILDNFQFAQELNEIDISILPAGIYYLVITNNEYKSTIKIVKE